MTRPEPAGAGTAETPATLTARIVTVVLHALDGQRDARVFDAISALIAAAITAAESRAMERCAKIAEALIVRVNVTGPHDDYAQGKKDAAAEIYQTILAIRSSINPPGEEE